ncbi:UDP-3-O-acyl-N-acetylglucosamine deacetylase [Maliponia aquimaris]|uniref:UDP-3-O-acyl-N-acetylglucosamine deacetylase n=1 Tax=Maliponia aquimaris TaxID=1673631 RepID=A0A238KL61_9RHOB|nr:UDP-3-O-acyl-N-acetylglucosamine deacetylase [Maliponia aquimaris]SMX43483.1 UDP-3-O-[3-hydroxymyristoyl] N-acetylglucosamine deacetylase [Maliponia aquimaris]
MQTTLRSPITFTGVGLHSGAAARLTIRPASADYGIWFKRTDIALGDTMIPARWDSVEASPLCTMIVNRAGASVSTVEHVMAALAGCGVHNALIEIDGPEAPILDGSSVPFVRGILSRGLRALATPIRAIEVLKPVSVDTGRGWARLLPGAPGQGLTMSFHIAFADAAIGEQTKTLNLANGTFVRELSDSRTFCRAADVAAMRAAGKALGGTYENAVVVDGDRVLSPGGLRHADEAVRHKMLDALGDLALAGAPIVGHYEGHKAGHALTNALLRELFATPGASRVVLCDAGQAARLPGAGVERHEIPAVA